MSYGLNNTRNENGLSVIHIDNYTVELYIYNDISEDGISAKALLHTFSPLVNSGKLIKLRINCSYGNVFDAINIFSVFYKHTNKIHAYIDSIAKGAGTIIALSASKIYVSEYALLYADRPMSALKGSAAEIKHKVAELEKFENFLAEIYSNRTGLNISEAHKAFLNENPVMLTPSAALQMKLIDGIITNRNTQKVNTELRSAYLNSLSWHELDKQDLLEELKQTDFENFKHKFQDTFNCNYRTT